MVGNPDLPALQQALGQRLKGIGRHAAGTDWDQAHRLGERLSAESALGEHGASPHIGSSRSVRWQADRGPHNDLRQPHYGTSDRQGFVTRS